MENFLGGGNLPAGVMQQLFMGGITGKRTTLADSALTGGDNPNAEMRRRNERRASVVHDMLAMEDARDDQDLRNEDSDRDGRTMTVGGATFRTNHLGISVHKRTPMKVKYCRPVCLLL